MALLAICAGDRGTWDERSCAPPEPVTAQVIKGRKFGLRGIADSILSSFSGDI